jgi:hypothetical protein
MWSSTFNYFIQLLKFMLVEAPQTIFYHGHEKQRNDCANKKSYEQTLNHQN